METKIDTGSTGNDGRQLQKSVIAYRQVDGNEPMIGVIYDDKMWEIKVPENEKIVELNYDNNEIVLKTNKNIYKQ